MVFYFFTTCWSYIPFIHSIIELCIIKVSFCQFQEVSAFQEVSSKDKPEMEPIKEESESPTPNSPTARKIENADKQSQSEAQNIVETQGDDSGGGGDKT